MKIRNADIEDIENLKKIKSFLTDDQINERLKLQKDLSVNWLVIEENQEIAGFVLLKWKGKATHPGYPDLEDLYIKENYRGKGLAKILIAECEKLAKAKGFKKIGMAVNPKNNCQAKILYEKLDYKHDGRKSYLDGVYNGVEDWVIDLEKDL